MTLTATVIFGNTAKIPFTPNMLQRRADQDWKQAKLERITPHVGRHSFAAMCIAGGINAKAPSTFMGHVSIQVTYDKYGGLLPRKLLVCWTPTSRRSWTTLRRRLAVRLANVLANNWRTSAAKCRIAGP